MKLASFLLDGQPAYGLVEVDHYLMPAADFAARYPDLSSVLQADALNALSRSAASAGRRVSMAATRLQPVIPNPRKFICVGLNYKTHVAEMKRADSEYPALFVRFADSLTHAGAEVLRPSFSDRFDFEGELAVVIGRGGRAITQEDAYQHVAGYACFNDITVRDWQRHTHQWTPGKNFPGTGALGPYMVTADEVGDVEALTLTTQLNGVTVQQASLADLIFTIPVLIAYISRFTALSPGDVIATGTPGGVGDKREPPLYMKHGDRIEVQIASESVSLGTLRNTIGTEA